MEENNNNNNNNEVSQKVISIAPLNIVGFENNKNLRELSWNQKTLEKIKKDYDLAHGEAVIFRNVVQDRFRLVANFFNIPNLIIPPIDHVEKTSLDLKIAHFLRKFRISFGYFGRYFM